jgi:hypothetical protein
MTMSADHGLQPKPPFTQQQIDQLQPPTGDRLRYRLKGFGSISIGDLRVMGKIDPDPGGFNARNTGRSFPILPSQFVWLSPAFAAEFGDLVELAP